MYWRLCWGILTPGLMFVIIVYNLITLQPLTYNSYVYPDVAYSKHIHIFHISTTLSKIYTFLSAWLVFVCARNYATANMGGLCHLSIRRWFNIPGIFLFDSFQFVKIYFAIFFFKYYSKRIIIAFQPTADWGPAEPDNFKLYQEMEAAHAEKIRSQPKRGLFGRIRRNIFE